jgi:hypothetical protein
MQSVRFSVLVCSAIAFAIGMILGGPALRPAKAATNATVSQSAAPKPSCLRRVTIKSSPCDAAIYIDGMQVGRTPISFPMPAGRYTLVLVAPGHQEFARRFLVKDAPLEINANLVALE